MLLHGLLGDRADRWEVKDHGSGVQKDAGDEAMADGQRGQRQAGRGRVAFHGKVSVSSKGSIGTRKG